MVADGLVMQGANVSAAIALAEFFLNIPAPEGLWLSQIGIYCSSMSQDNFIECIFFIVVLELCDIICQVYNKKTCCHL